MKILRIILLLLLLCGTTDIYACYDDSDDYWNKDDNWTIGDWDDTWNDYWNSYWGDGDDDDGSDDDDGDDDPEDDWWRTTDGDEPYDDGDDGYNNDVDDSSIGSYHPDNNSSENTNNPPLLPNDVHSPVDGEVLFRDNLPAQTITQRTPMDCVSTSLGILYSLTGAENSSSEIRSEIEFAYKSITGENISEVGIYTNENLEVLLSTTLSFAQIEITDVPSVIDDGIPVLGVICSEEGNNEHMVVIVGYYDDYGGADAFQCINPGTGQYETHYDYEFTVKDLDDNSKTNSYIYRKD